MNRNHLKYIKENTFQNNALLIYFACAACNIKSMPTNYGPCTSSFKTFSVINGIDRCAVSAIFRCPYFRAFASLRAVGLARLPLKNMANLELPPSTESIRIVFADLTAFPNLTSSDFPKITYLNITTNPINIIPDGVWQHMTVCRYSMSTKLDSHGQFNPETKFTGNSYIK